MRLYKLLLLSLVVLTMSCSQPKPFVFKGVQSIKIEKASWVKNIFKADFVYENPNNFSLSLQKLEADIFINDQLFTHYKLDTTFSIPAEATFKLPAGSTPPSHTAPAKIEETSGKPAGTFGTM